MIKTSGNRHHVVIIGAGFGGIEVANQLAGTEVDVTIIDRRNHHLFQPLLYQVAGASLSTSEIAWPIRYLFRNRPEVNTLMAEVEGVDQDAREVILNNGSRQSYDTLVLATGATHAYFGHDEWEPFAPGLKTLEDATTIRGRILAAFEEAERTSDPQQRAALQTFVIIGGGPTGVELAGTIAELARDTLARDFRSIDPSTSRVVLIEAGQRLLSVFPEDLSAYTRQALEKLGVEVVLGTPVTGCSAEGVVYGGTPLSARTIVWAAGVQASPAARWLSATSDRAGRVVVGPDLTVAGHPEIFAIGDTASCTMPDGKPVPGIAPAAKQQGKYVASLIGRRLKGKPVDGPFKYRHQGNLATIGRSLAVIDMGRVKLRGAFAWWIWKLAHIYFLIGTQNRLSVALSWVWNHSIGYRGSRIIMRASTDRDRTSASMTLGKSGHLD
ncbi:MULTISPECIES: NAD(P)/FAD-dependent oxidoreductase [Burkholderiaceae]|jgi:NADH dehydrogenase|uniref:NADH:ubiquinone reductase (non-electrogenic) n=2 Tax=Burkholderiaceae TaxID=119060 RepID=B2SZY5_PARPJ|nr:MULTISPECIES: NAD(P)/FAD-dependent oxidoreductase [Burkholderiaceae]UTP22237.1 NAD(P)/FAD-dependent oxidoreductase [Burkholderia sp. FXe9]ACD14546.1 FAD-dependent pyridine nucleotide-disulphide oxidoreductase [Paraburkholderia phytofirmans PsJN]ERJ33953.1 NADH dehydrogenase [Burkholderia sp. AU4i]MBA9949184.1 NAD(P)/FAD-dependent oxidoreductase [Burkholderia cepacia]MBA9979478.1 NAD(P)/FAD-dependent oxidoreductase [Burkholderia cepacia]